MYIVILVTAANRREAGRIADALIKDKLAACVNIIEKVDSVFWWEGKVDCAKEVLLVIKSKRALFNKLAKKVRLLHSYEVPEIIAVPVVAGDKKYLKWLNESTR